MFPGSVLSLIRKPMGGYDPIGSQDPHLMRGGQIRTRPSRQRHRRQGPDPDRLGTQLPSFEFSRAVTSL